MCYVISEWLRKLHPQDLQGMLHGSLEVILNENGMAPARKGRTASVDVQRFGVPLPLQ